MNKLLLLLLLPFSALAQYKGIWNGYINNDAGGTSNYILNIKDEAEGVVKGDAYIYKRIQNIFEGKINFIGVIKNQKLNIKELKILFNKMPNDSSSMF